MATVHPLPPSEIYIDRRPIPEETLEEQIKENINDMHYKACRLCEKHRIIIIVFVACLCIGSIVVSVMLKSVNTNINLCFYYTDSTLASDVSVQCIKYLWSSFQCTTALESSPTWHWWLQSPQGLTMVKCDAYYTGSACGVGSYNNIKNYISLCNPRFGQ